MLGSLSSVQQVLASFPSATKWGGTLALHKNIINTH